MTAAPLTPSRHVPERTCVACRRKRPQQELLRVTREAGRWSVRAGNRVGRGAYVCADTPECWQEKRLRRAFRAQAAEIAEQLQTHHKDPNQNHSAPGARVSPEVSHV
ncbi:YlxR family protein [Deinococcus humi]|uniref:YlxR domain-containing protein n=1 Tax=Deinococcus humi TaxID=662880 RepID=A0A7W8NDT0_9DEIO|nr:YlxR family protein [Deinococcus humi]MBB5361950.1 hypothetical protein [Deinococcus humi]GGO22841.1 hypothetical protein GCM10008949_10450 [Deinococcus humi]